MVKVFSYDFPFSENLVMYKSDTLQTSCIPFLLNGGKSSIEALFLEIVNNYSVIIFTLELRKLANIKLAARFPMFHYMCMFIMQFFFSRSSCCQRTWWRDQT